MPERRDKLKTHTVFGSENYSIGLPEITLADLQRRDTCFLIAPDESMNGSMIRQGSLVAYEPYHKLVPGAIYYVRWIGKQILRKLYRQRDGMLLMPNNPNYQNVLIPNDNLSEFIIYGEVVWSFYSHCEITKHYEKVIRNLIKRDYAQ